MVRNTLGDLNNHLFEQMERLNNDELTGEALTQEINRSKAMMNIAGKIIDTGKLVLEAQVAYDEHIQASAEKPKMLEG